MKCHKSWEGGEVERVSNSKNTFVIFLGNFVLRKKSVRKEENGGVEQVMPNNWTNSSLFFKIRGNNVRKISTAVGINFEIKFYTRNKYRKTWNWVENFLKLVFKRNETDSENFSNSLGISIFQKIANFHHHYFLKLQRAQLPPYFSHPNHHWFISQDHSRKFNQTK